MLKETETNMTSEANDAGVPVSIKIRERLLASRKRFHANDNIADFIEPGELDKLLDEVADKMKGVLSSLVIDTEHDHNTADTARRVAKMYVQEVFRGRFVNPPVITEFPNAEHLNELMIVGPITVRSACSHHFCPVIGKIWIGVLPNEHTNVIGLSKYARLAEWVMGRPQIQEEAVVQLADLIQVKTQPDGLAIVMEASHYCMAWRGVKDMDSRMINSVMRGAFLKDPNLRREFLSLIPKRTDGMLVRLLYVSRALDPNATAATDSILAVAREHNMANGITGILCYGGGICCKPLKVGVTKSTTCTRKSSATSAIPMWCCLTMKKLLSAVLVVGPWGRSICPNSIPRWC